MRPLQPDRPPADRAVWMPPLRFGRDPSVGQGQRPSPLPMLGLSQDVQSVHRHAGGRVAQEGSLARSGLRLDRRRDSGEGGRTLPNSTPARPSDGGIAFWRLSISTSRSGFRALSRPTRPSFWSRSKVGEAGCRGRRANGAAKLRSGADIDLSSYFDNVRHDRLLAKVAERVDDGDVMRLLKVMLKANGKQGVPQGGVISPLLSNLYSRPSKFCNRRSRSQRRHVRRRSPPPRRCEFEGGSR